MKSNRPQISNNSSANTSDSKASIKSNNQNPKPLLYPWKCVPLCEMNQVRLLKKKNTKTVRYIEIFEDEEVNTQSIVRVLRKLKVCRSLYVGIDQQCGTGDTAGYVWKLYDGLKHLKSISALKSYNCFTPNYSEDEERSLATILRPFPLLKKVLISNDRGDFSDKGARNLSEMLSPLPNLSVISLSLDLTEESTAKGIHDSLIRLKHAFRLVSLKLQLPGNVSMQPLIMVLNRLKLLSTLDLHFLTPVSAEDLQSICFSIQALSLLSALSLNMDCSLENTEVASISRMLQHLNVLTALELSFRGQKVNNATLINLYKSIRHFEKMTMFNLHITGVHENGNEAFQEFSHALHCMSRLRKLNFSFYGFDKVTCTGAINVFQPLEQMTSLTVLSITLDKFIIDEDLQNFGTVLSSLKLLSELELRFDWASQKEDRGIKSFFSGLKNCTLLQKVEFVAFSLYIDDEALKIMIESIKHLNLLSYFYIVCHNCQGVTNAGVRILSNGFNNLRLLSYFCLILTHCNNVSKEEIAIFDKKVEKMSVSGRKEARISNT